MPDSTDAALARATNSETIIAWCAVIAEEMALFNAMFWFLFLLFVILVPPAWPGGPGCVAVYASWFDIIAPCMASLASASVLISFVAIATRQTGAIRHMLISLVSVSLWVWLTLALPH